MLEASSLLRAELHFEDIYMKIREIKFANTSFIGRIDDIILYHQVLVNEVGRKFWLATMPPTFAAAKYTSLIRF